MKQFSELQLKLLHLLSDGQIYSGTFIGKQLGVSRTAIWKQIKQLADLGLAIRPIAQQGYQLYQPLIPLDESLIRQQLLDRQFTKPLNFHLFAEINSTNQFLKELAVNSTINICCSEKQTQGRGRFGRQWHSPFGENIYFSGRWLLNCCLSALSGLSLVVGLAIKACFKDSHIEEDIGLKWPNDLFWQDKKLGGILIEVTAESNGSAQVIIGIGINVNQSFVDLPWCSLYEITNHYFDRNNLIANLIFQLNVYLDKFLEEGFAAFAEEWQIYDYLRGQEITLTQSTGSLSGQACGVNQLGQLCLRDKHGKIHYLSSGETTLNKLSR